MGERRTHGGYEYEQQPDGSWRRLAPVAQQGQVFADPAAQYEVPAAQADIGSTQASTRNANVNASVTEATAPTTITTANLPPGYMWNDPSNPDAGVTRIPGFAGEGQSLTAGQREAAIQAQQDAASLRRTVQELRDLYAQGPGATQGIWGVQDYLPSAVNRNFNDAAQRARGTVRRALGFTGGEANTAQESEAIYAPYLPSAGMLDGNIIPKIEALEGLANDAENRANALLGTAPGPSAMDQTFINTGPAATQTGSGQTSDPIPPEMQQEYQAWVLGNVANMTPENYTAFRQQLDRKYGFESGDYTGEAERIIDGFRNGGTLNLAIPPVNRDMTELETSADAAVRSPMGAFAANAANMIGAGGAEAFAGGEGFAALRNEFPVSSTLGEIAGAMGGTTLLGRAGAATIGRAAPRLLGGSGRAQFGRNLATDIAYSGAYGGNTGQGIAGTATEGGVGSVAGQLLGRGVGRAVSGVNVSPAVDYLRSRNIPLTTGQTLGDFANRVEQRAMSIPGVGDMIANRRMDGIEAFDRAALSDAGAPIGFSPTRIGREGVADLMGDRAAGSRGAINDAYDNAVAGQSFALDPQLMADVDAAALRAERLPPDLRTNADRALQNTFEPLANNTAVTGPQWQGMRRDLAGYRAEQTGPGFPSDYRNVMDMSVDALDGLASRQGGPEVVENLNNANRANRLGNIVQDAAYRADGADYRFTPSQLQDANKASGRRFPGQNPLAELADNAQQVLPQTIPNSGSADRLMQAAMTGGTLSSLGALGAGAGYMVGGDPSSAATGAGIPTAAMILAALGGTKSGQRAINAMLTQRTPSARALGESVRRNSGLFGSAAIPLTLTRD